MKINQMVGPDGLEWQNPPIRRTAAFVMQIMRGWKRAWQGSDSKPQIGNRLLKPYSELVSNN
jgi:hypothetical protein